MFQPPRAPTSDFRNSSLVLNPISHLPAGPSDPSFQLELECDHVSAPSRRSSGLGVSRHPSLPGSWQTNRDRLFPASSLPPPVSPARRSRVPVKPDKESRLAGTKRPSRQPRVVWLFSLWRFLFLPLFFHFAPARPASLSTPGAPAYFGAFVARYLCDLLAHLRRIFAQMSPSSGVYSDRSIKITVHDFLSPLACLLFVAYITWVTYCTIYLLLLFILCPPQENISSMRVEICFLSLHLSHH